MKQICQGDCLRCPYDDCVLEIDTQQIAPKELLCENTTPQSTSIMHESKKLYQQLNNKVKNNAYYKLHIEEIRVKNRVYYEQHREELRAKQAAYRAQHREELREELRAKQAAYRAQHREELRAYYAAYRAQHREEINRRARERRQQKKALAAANKGQ